MRVENIVNATLYLGDCREILPTLPKFDSVVTDPPYGMKFQSNNRASKHLEIANDGDSKMLKWACDLSSDHSSYIFCRWDNLLDGVPKPKSLITWIKNNWSMGDLEHEHARQTEVALFYPGPKHLWPGRRPQDVVRADRSLNSYHPTEKPIYLMEVIVGWTIGTVFDPFMGSGTTGVACANLGREFIGIEIEPKYFDIACERIDAAYAQGRLFE